MPSAFRQLAQTLGVDTAPTGQPPKNIPSVLRTFFNDVGDERLLSGFHRFLTGDELQRVNGYLLFLEENQGVVLWGVRADGSDDPEVVQFPIVGDELDGPFPEGVPLSTFLLAIMVMQLTHGDALAHVGHQELAETQKAAALLADGELLPIAKVNGLHAFAGPGVAATLVAGGDEEGATLLLATDDLDRFEHWALVLGVDPVDFAV
jgi:hypothetical protein